MNIKHTVIAAALVATGMFAINANALTASASFQVKMTITKACTVSAGSGSDISLGSFASNSGSHSGSNSINVTCSKTTPYFIGLAPSNASTTGAGVMSGTGSNTDQVPYQLYSNAGYSTVWGNTATTTTIGNGVAGAGSGLAQTISVYATAPSANFTPDSYADTVTVTVNY
ncbi:MAG: spore coat protein U domain-containing protein [Dokdonella sp.]